MASNSKKQKKPPIFDKLKARIIEEIAIRQIVDSISDEDGIMLPREWWTAIEETREFLTRLVEDESVAE